MDTATILVGRRFTMNIIHHDIILHLPKSHGSKYSLILFYMSLRTSKTTWNNSFIWISYLQWITRYRIYSLLSIYRYNSYNADTYDTDEDELSEFIVEDDEIDDENSTSDGTDDDDKMHTVVAWLFNSFKFQY